MSITQKNENEDSQVGKEYFEEDSLNKESFFIIAPNRE